MSRPRVGPMNWALRRLRIRNAFDQMRRTRSGDSWDLLRIATEMIDSRFGA